MLSRSISNAEYNTVDQKSVTDQQKWINFLINSRAFTLRVCLHFSYLTDGWNVEFNIRYLRQIRPDLPILVAMLCNAKWSTAKLLLLHLATSWARLRYNISSSERDNNKKIFYRPHFLWKWYFEDFRK